MSDLVNFRTNAEAQLNDCGISIIDNERLDTIISRLKLIVSNKDATLVSGTDPSELETVRKNFVEKHCGVDDKAKGLAAIEKVVDKMSSIKMKNRAAFYYLVQEELNWA
ncbi:MAG: DUF2853 family protein [Flavobacteriaceae bacterium]|nr:DUF2853 family protein [Flavobacteriaceae bacterium]